MRFIRRRLSRRLRQPDSRVGPLPRVGPGVPSLPVDCSKRLSSMKEIDFYLLLETAKFADIDSRRCCLVTMHRKVDCWLMEWPSPLRPGTYRDSGTRGPSKSGTGTRGSEGRAGLVQGLGDPRAGQVWYRDSGTRGPGRSGTGTRGSEGREGAKAVWRGAGAYSDVLMCEAEAYSFRQ